MAFYQACKCILSPLQALPVVLLTMGNVNLKLEYFLLAAGHQSVHNIVSFFFFFSFFPLLFLVSVCMIAGLFRVLISEVVVQG